MRNRYASSTLSLFILTAASLLAALPTFSLDWPVQKRIVTGTFGEDRGDHFHNGIDIGGGAQEVHPVLPGELVFRYVEGSDYSSLPRGVGSFVVLHHDQDILSAYCHLASDSLGSPKKRYSPSDMIGVIGDTGHSEGKHLHFVVFDEEADASVNPLALLSSAPDAQPPVIKRVQVSWGEELQALGSGATVRPGTAEVIAELYDLREDVKFLWPISPYSVRLSLDGKEIARTLFDSLRVSEGRMVVSGSERTRESLYRRDGLMRCGTIVLRAGESRIRLSVRDYAGNETVREIAITVRD